MYYRRLGLLAAGAVGLGLFATVWVFRPQPAAPPVDRPDDLAAAPAPRGPDPFSYSAAFDAQLARIGQITPAEFAARHPTPAYLPKLSWDPTTARFFDQLNVETVVKENPLPDDVAKMNLPPEQLAAVRRGLRVELRGYKLTPDELAVYQRNGFVVSERLGGYSFGQVYYDVYSRDLPVFVSADSVLHAWHRSYDAMLEELERTYLAHALDAILAGMHDAVPAARQRYGDSILKDAVGDADYFLAVARSLLKDAPVPSKLGQDERVRATLAAVTGEQMQQFELFGRGREMDFSQFKPRGHYETIPELRRYFKAMMWCGRTDLRVAGGADATGPLSAPRELGAAVVLFDLLRSAGKEEAWRQFDRTIQTFVGRTDSATFDDLARVAAAAEVRSPADLRTDDDLRRLADVVAVSGAGRQEVRGDVFVAPPGGKVALPRSFTVLGQKFAVDSWVTAKVVFSDVLWDGQPVARRVPSGLDVAFAALGNSHVVPEVVGRIEGGPHRFRDRQPYQHNLAAARAVLDGLPAGAWDETVYTAWLKTLRTLSAPADARAPEAMRTREWAMKATNTQLASWAQLRHDTILYVKQSYTSRVMCYYPAGFVEPVVPFWAQLEATARRSAALLEATPFPPAVASTRAKQAAFLRNFAEQTGRLKGIAEKQLAQAELSADERKVLEDVMQVVHQRGGSGPGVPRYTGWYPGLFYRGREDSVKWDALVADVHTDTPAPILGDPGCVLHQGVGGVDLMVVAVDNGKDRVVYAGPTFSHYEFELGGTARKTDREWKTDLLDGRVPPRPEWTRGYLVPQPNRPPVDAGLRQWMLLEP